MPEPMLLDATEGPMGLEPQFLERLPLRDVIAPETVPVLARAMQAVAIYGTAAGVAPPGFPIAMKTGTGAEWRLGYHANYVGVAPWPNPVVAFGLRITHEPTSARVNRTAREVLRALLEGLHRRVPDRRWSANQERHQGPTPVKGRSGRRRARGAVDRLGGEVFGR